MKDRLLFNGIHIQRNGTAKDEAIEFPFPVLSHSTDALL
jgi:hypothetical protein